MPTIFNSGSGEWTAKATWQGGEVPTAADDVFLDFFDPSRPSRSYVVDLDTGGAVHNLMILAKNELSIGATLQLDSLIISDGTLSGSGGQIEVTKVVQNGGTIVANTVGGLEFDGPGTLFNMGTLSAVGNGNGNSIGSGLEIINSGLIEAIDGGEMTLTSIKNTGVITASGQGSIIQAGGAILNAGTIQSVDGAIFMIGDTTNGHGGAVIVDGGGLQVNGVIDGGTVTILNNGSFFSVPFAGGENPTHRCFLPEPAC